MSDCIFCKIVAGEIPSTKVYEDDLVYAFRDINPQAPEHILVIPKEHIACGVCEVNSENAHVIGHVFEVIAKITKELQIQDYRVVSNNGDGAGQTVKHIHFHVLGGRELDLTMG